MTESKVDEAKERVSIIKGRVQAYRARHPWLQHVIAAWQLLSRNNGNQYAAAITYFSFLALFPLLLMAVSITGFVLHSHPHLETQFFDKISQKVPGQFGHTLQTGLKDAIKARASVGVAGLLGVALAGGAWIGNMRSAIDGVWGRTSAKRNVLLARVLNLGVLGGLGLGLLVSVGLTAIGTSLTDQILRGLGLDDLPGAGVVLKILGIAIAAFADMIIFWWVLVRLPQQQVPRRVALQGSAMASVGFEVLKIVGTFTIAHTANSPTAGPFASLLAVLIWIQLVARYLLFVCAWMATAVVSAAEPMPVAVAVEDVARPDGPRPALVGAALVGAGAAAGAAASWAVSPQGRRRIGRWWRHRPTPPRASSQPW